LTFAATCAIIIIVKGRGKEWPRRCPRKKINQKKVRKPLDKPLHLWYNKYVSERDKELHFT
jgi:hypothetical protein